MNKTAILETYSRAALQRQEELCCAVDYRSEFPPEELDHIPEAVLDRNYGCGVPQELRVLGPGAHVLDLGPGVGRDCFLASRKVGREGKVYGLDMNDEMLGQAERYKETVVDRLGFDNIQFLKGQFDIQIPLPDDSVDVVLSNCVNNLATDKETAYREMFRVLRPGRKLSFSDIVSYAPLPPKLRENEKAWADCVAGVLSFEELNRFLNRAGFHGVSLTTEYLWSSGPRLLQNYFAGSPAPLTEAETGEIQAVRLYSVVIEAFKPVLDPRSECFWKGQYALYNGPGVSLQLDEDPQHVFPAGTLKEVCEKTATLLKSPPFDRFFTVFEPEGEVQPRACLPGGNCC